MVAGGQSHYYVILTMLHIPTPADHKHYYRSLITTGYTTLCHQLSTTQSENICQKITGFSAASVGAEIWLDSHG